MNFQLTLKEQLSTILEQENAVLLYFSTLSCNVGEALQPKVEQLIKIEFPKIKFFVVDMNFAPELTSALTVFVEPTILVFFDGKETIRKSRNIGVGELHLAIERSYKLFFD